jgi:Glutamine amidotransferase class-I
VSRVVVFGAGAERAAAALIRSLAPVQAVAAYAGPGCRTNGSTNFVTADGRFLPNDALWLEWAAGRPLPATVPEHAPDDAVLVIAAAHPALVRTAGSELIDAPALPVYADRFGRPSLKPAPEKQRREKQGQEKQGGRCHIGVLGEAHHHRTVYPAVLARLGDAADRTGIAVEPVILPARRDLAGLDGMILPGGADMGQVAAQIAVAEDALVEGVPLFGLCLGMQSMATALLRRAAWPDAEFEEIAGPGPRRSFVRMRDPDGQALHRLGDHAFQPAPGTRLAGLLPGGATIRMNHRYGFNPAIDTAALAGTTFHWTGDILHGIEVGAHPFFVGLQGHPEIGCDRALDAVWDGFLRAALAHGAGDARRRTR